jgi:hypothetical protein
MPDPVAGQNVHTAQDQAGPARPFQPGIMSKAVLRHRSRLFSDRGFAWQAGCAGCEGAKVSAVPLADVAIGGLVLAHRRYPDAVLELDIADF